MLANGKYMDFLNPDPDAIDIPTIAASLSKQCRFSGHTVRFYSVAEHCYWASYVASPAHRLAALLHDAAEAFVVDVPTPLKDLLPDYRAIEARFHDLIDEKFDVVTRHPEVKRADLIMLATEKRDLLPPTRDWDMLSGIAPMTKSIDYYSGNPLIWERRFLNRYMELTQ